MQIVYRIMLVIRLSIIGPREKKFELECFVLWMRFFNRLYLSFPLISFLVTPRENFTNFMYQNYNDLMLK